MYDIENNTDYYVTTSTFSESSKYSGMQTPSSLESMIGNDNYSFLMAMGMNATISFHGDDANKRSWTQLRGTIEPGDQTITLNNRTSWNVGDRVAIASTDFDLNQAEDFTITSVTNNGRIITLDRPIEYMHYGEIEKYSNNRREWDLDMRAEVGLLSRNIKIKGDVNYDPNIGVNYQNDEFGGHVMVMMGGKMYVSGVEFEYMGQAAKLGRYPAHWHLLADASGQYIKNSSFHHTFNKGVTIHGTHNTQVHDNVVYETIGHSYFLEDGSEVNNDLRRNLAINTRKPGEGRPESPRSFDRASASNFWIENSNNTFISNHGAGSEGHGFFFDLRGINGASRGMAVYDDLESREGPKDGDFVRNHAHSSHFAFFLNHVDFVTDLTFRGDDANPQQVDESWRVDDFTAYKCEIGTYARGIGGEFNDVKIGEVETATRYRLNQTLKNSLIVGRTDNLGTPKDHETEYGRSLPPNAPDDRFAGHQIYDGPSGLEDVHFVGFTGDIDAAILRTNAVKKSTLHYVSALTFDADIPEENKLNMGSNVIETFGIVDIDGSLTAEAGSFLTSLPNRLYRDFNATPNSFIESMWNVQIHQPGAVLGTFMYHGRIYKEEDDTRTVNGDKNIIDGKISTRVYMSKGDNIVIQNPIEISNTVRNEFMVQSGSATDVYKLRFGNASNSFTLYLNDLPYGESVIFELDGLDYNDTFFALDDHDGDRIDDYDEEAIPLVLTREELDNASKTTVYKDDETETFFIKMVANQRHGWAYPQPRMTFNDFQAAGTRVNVTLSEERFLSAEASAEAEVSILQLSPNPAQDNLHISFADYDVTDSIVEITSLSGGQVVMTLNAQPEMNVDISSLSNVMYIVSLKKDGVVLFSETLIKE